MNCHEVKKMLSDYLDLQLPQEQYSEICLHLESCIPCTQEMRRLKAAWEVLGQWQEVNPSLHFKQRFWEKISELEKQKASKGSISWGWRISWVPVGSMAAVLLVILTWFFWPSAEREAQVSQPEQNNSLVELVASLDLLEDKELLAEMDLLENFDLLLALEEISDAPDREG